MFMQQVPIWTAGLLVMCVQLATAMSLTQGYNRATRTWSDGEWGNWPCPVFYCHEVPSSCNHREVITWRVGDHECIGCPYCLDISVPTQARPPEGRMRRELQPLSVTRNKLCTAVTCPTPTPDVTCQNVDLLHGHLDNKACIVCEFCAEDRLR